MSPRQSTFETAQLVLELGRSYAVKTAKHISGLNEPWDFFFFFVLAQKEFSER